MLIDLDESNTTSTATIIPNTSADILDPFSSETFVNSKFPPFLPSNYHPNNCKVLQQLNLNDNQNGITPKIEVDDTFLERCDLDNYYYFKRKKNIRLWNKRNNKHRQTHDIDDNITDNISQYSFIEPETLTFDVQLNIDKMLEWDTQVKCCPTSMIAGWSIFVKLH